MTDDTTTDTTDAEEYREQMLESQREQLELIEDLADSLGVDIPEEGSK